MPDDVFARRARLAKVLANPARLQMVDALAKVDELCVCELVDLVGLDQTTVSKHLALLRSAGLVDSRKQGLQVYYTLRTTCVIKFFECADRVANAVRTNEICC